MDVDRILSAMARLARAANPRIDYFGLYEARMVNQSGPNTFDLMPLAAHIPPMANVKIMQGLPGLEVSVAPGAFMLLGWRGGNPRDPYCMLWGGGVTEVVSQLTITASLIRLGGTTPVARMGDTVEVTIPPATLIPGVGTTSGSLNVSGEITSGSSVVRAG